MNDFFALIYKYVDKLWYRILLRLIYFVVIVLGLLAVMISTKNSKMLIEALKEME